MKKIVFLVAFLFALSMVTISSVNAVVFTSTAPSALISETSGTFNGSINYSSPDPVTSAVLTIFLSDDVSSIFSPNIDAPVETVILSTGGLSDTKDIDPQPFPASEANAGTAAAAGIEDPSVLPSEAGYFDLDVTSLINASGILNFALDVPNLFGPVLNGSAVFNLIDAEATALGFPPLTGNLPVFEDVQFVRAELNIIGGATGIPTPSAIWLMGLGLLGLLVARRKAA